MLQAGANTLNVIAAELHLTRLPFRKLPEHIQQNYHCSPEEPGHKSERG